MHQSDEAIYIAVVVRRRPTKYGMYELDSTQWERWITDNLATLEVNRQGHALRPHIRNKPYLAQGKATPPLLRPEQHQTALDWTDTARRRSGWWRGLLIGMGILCLVGSVYFFWLAVK